MLCHPIDEIRLGIVGLGNHIGSYLKAIKAHPKVTYVAAAEKMAERRNRYPGYVDTVYESLDEMLEKDDRINCVAVYSQRHQHGSQVIQALKAGKHVMSAVPMGISLDEIREITRLVEEKNLIYMMFETCYYWPCAVWCRKRFEEGGFGTFVYGEAQYYHTIQDMFGSFAGSGGTEWKRIAGVPPMYYATHSVSMLFSSIHDHAVRVSCFGMEDMHDADIYGKGKNEWDNPFCNETAIFTMSKGGFARINEFRRVGNIRPTSYITGIYGDNGTYECAGANHLYCSSGTSPEKRTYADRVFEDVSDQINSDYYTQRGLAPSAVSLDYSCHCGFSPVQNYQRLPRELLELSEKCIAEKDWNTTGHNGTHILLLDDFVRCCLTGKQSVLNAWTAARFTIPGIIAHESAMNGGIPMDIPDLGDMPDKFELMDYNDIQY